MSKISLFKYIIVNILGTLLRVFPWPCKTGLIKIGYPNRNSPVFVTCNYYLTVERVKRILRENNIDCYLLIANSRGINVWCAAAGGHFTNYDVISILKTSGIEKLVDHRKLILPQLAAVGIEAKIIKEKTGWNIIWGPVYAKDIPAFIKNNFKKTFEMRETIFPLVQRVEIAIAWAFPYSIVIGLIIAFLWPETMNPVIISEKWEFKVEWSTNTIKLSKNENPVGWHGIFKQDYSYKEGIALLNENGELIAISNNLLQAKEL